MTPRLTLRSLTLSLLLISNSVAAQMPQAGKESEEEKAKARKELERKALVLLDETLQGAQVLKLPENRAAIRVQAADLIWARDEKRARSLFRDAAADIAASRAGDNSGRTRSAWMLMQLRAQLLNTAASRDPQLALELLRDSRPPATARAPEKPKPLLLEESDVRELADIVSVAALKDSSAMGAYGLTLALRPLLPELEKRVPARAAQLRARMAEIDKALDPRARVWMQFDSVMSKPAEAILEEAPKAPAEMRGEFYTAAAMKLLHAGEVERARQVASDNLRGEQREQALAHIERAEVARAVERGSTEEAKAVVAGIKSKERRARALAEVAVAFALKGDRKSAAQLLEEARGLIDRRPDNEREIEALFEVARGYALVEPARTFEMIDPLIDHANDLLTAAALLEKFGQGGGIFRKGEMVVVLGLGELGGAYARYVKALSELARVDFERTKAAADRFNRDEARLMARVIVARSVLSDRHGDAGPPTPGYGLGGGGVIIAQ